MKTAQLVFSLVALSLMGTTFALGYTGVLHPFSARALFAVIVTVWAFLALLPYHKEITK
jgi:hypothetical protein